MEIDLIKYVVCSAMKFNTIDLFNPRLVSYILDL